jgi:hypothetical protein
MSRSDCNPAREEPGRDRRRDRGTRQWWRNGRIGGQKATSHVHHSWRPSTSENNFLSRNLAEPVADAPLCCARAPAHRHVAPRRPRSELFTWRRLRCPKGSCIGKRGEGRWWVRSPANSRTSFSKGQKDYRTMGTDSLEPFEPLRGGASGGPRDSVPIIAVLELTSLYPLRPPADDLLPR